MEILKQGGCVLANRFIVSLTLFYIAGIVVGRYLIENPKMFLIPSAGLVFFSAAALFFKWIGYYRLVILFVAALSGGVAFFYSIQQPVGSIIEHAGKFVYIEGTVSEEPFFYDDHDRYILRVEILEAGAGRKTVKGTLMVNLYGKNEDKFRYGDRLGLRGYIVEPRGERNPGGFDYRFYLKSRNIDALVYPRAGGVEYIGQAETSGLGAAAIRIRNRMIEVIDEALPAPSSELLAAVLFGHGHRLPEQIEHNFQRAGAGHLLAVSGLHVGLVAALITGLCNRLGLRGRFPLVLALILVLGYAYLTGMRPSALRAAIMVSMAIGALLLDRERDLPTAISVAALITLAVNPLLLFTPGFQLSYAATLTLVYGYRPLEALLAWIGFPIFLQRPLAVILAAQAGVLPLTIYYFHHLPVGAVFFNIILMPLIAFIIGLGLLGALIGLYFVFLGDILLWAARPLLELMLSIIKWSSLPGLYAPLSPPGIIALIIYYSLPACLLFLYYRWERMQDRSDQKITFRQYFKIVLAGIMPAWPLRRNVLYGTVLFAAAFFIWKGIFFPPPNELKVTFIDVGQGASALIEAPCGVVIMVDAGGELPYYGAPGDIGEKVLLPLFRQERIDKIDLAVITHSHEDHFGGFTPLVGSVDIDQFIISPAPGESAYYEELILKAKAKGIAIEQGRAGDMWSCCSCLVLDIYGPPEKLFSGTGSDLNNNSIVIRLTYGEIRMLFTGDIEEAAVGDLFKRRLDLQADLFQVPHHGGYLAQMPELLDRVRPGLAVIQVGTNPFGHPHPYVIQSLEKAGVRFFRNDQHGAIIVKTDGIELDVYITEKELPVAQ